MRFEHRGSVPSRLRATPDYHTFLRPDPRDPPPCDSVSRWTQTASTTGTGSTTGASSRRCSLVSGNRAATADAVDEAFARAFERWARVRTMDSPVGWTFTVARNLLRRAARRAQKERTLGVARRAGPGDRRRAVGHRSLARRSANGSWSRCATWPGSPKPRSRRRSASRREPSRAGCTTPARTCTRCSPPRRTWHDRSRRRTSRHSSTSRPNAPDVTRVARRAAQRRTPPAASAIAAAAVLVAVSASAEWSRSSSRGPRADCTRAAPARAGSRRPARARDDARRFATRDQRTAGARAHATPARVQRVARHRRPAAVRRRPHAVGRARRADGARRGRRSLPDPRRSRARRVTRRSFGVDAVVQYDDWCSWSRGATTRPTGPSSRRS